MAKQPTDQDVQGFLEMVGSMDRSEVIRRLKNNNNNIQGAVNEYFDDMETGKDSNRYRWDDTQFASDRDGGTSNNHGIAFTVQGADDPGPYSRFDGAPSRPPSRTSNNKSPLSKVVDLTGDQDPNTAFTHYGDSGDAELQQALAASMADVGLPPQQTGVIGTEQVHFGPANRNEYEQGRWEMVPTSSVQEIILDPEPAERLRDIANHQPAFLKPSVEDHRLGALLTIYHSIPIAREIFLNRIDTETYYPYEPEWWTGKPIEHPIRSGHVDQYLVDKDKRFGQEVQKVMAFLDKTDRSYGSADVIATLPFMKEQPEGSVEATFFTCWSQYMGDHGSWKNLFSRGVAGADGEQNQGPHTFALLEIHLPSKTSLAENFYDAADETLWWGSSFKLSESPYLQHMGHTISFKLQSDVKDPKSIHVPLVWYPDRYLEFARKEALEMRIQKSRVEQEIERIGQRENFLTYYNGKDGQALKVEDIFNRSLKHDQNEFGDASLSDNSEGVATKQQDGKLSEKLAKVMSDINDKLKALNEEKEKAKNAWRELSGLYTDPAKSSRPLHKYTLRGVSLTKETTFVCKAGEPDLIDMQLDDESQTQNEGQWWRIDYNTSSSTPITVEKTTAEKVVEAVDAEVGQVILVYASERAMEAASNSVPLPLEAFVREDNIAFRNEFPAEDISQEPATSPRSPPKRKYDQCSSSGSPAAEEWNRLENEKQAMVFDDVTLASSALQSRLSHGGGDVIMGIDPVVDGKAQSGQEMQERSGNGILTHLAQNQSKKNVANDNMELDEIMNDEDVREESAAVKHVGFAE